MNEELKEFLSELIQDYVSEREYDIEHSRLEEHEIEDLQNEIDNAYFYLSQLNKIFTNKQFLTIIKNSFKS